jgi:SAM-dependent methyltransferase
VVYEAGRALGPPHSPHADIRASGSGRFSHWQELVYFSASDGSDPNTNGRAYTYSLSGWRFRQVAGPDAPAVVPTNHRPRDCRPEQIQADVAQALRWGQTYREMLGRLAAPLAGKTALEVGPGVNCGCVMVLAAHGMRPIVADRFLTAWEPAYHAEFYAALAGELERTDPAADVRPLRALVAAGGYDEAVITRIPSALEELPLPAASVDVALSLAVLEHVYDLGRSFRQLHRVTRPGGVGLHWIDFRDHRDYARPLEYLLLAERDFQRLFAGCQGECGNRHRPDEASALLRAAGFEELSREGYIFSEPAYLADFLPRLRAARQSRYRRLTAEQLRMISAVFQVRKSA